MKNQARFFFCVCVARYKLVAGKTAFLHHLWSKQNYEALFVYRSDLGQNLCHFLPYFTYNSAVFHRIILQLQIAIIQFRAIEARTSLALAQQLIQNKKNIKRFCMEDSTIRQDCSVTSIYFCVAYRVIIGFEQKRSKRSW